MRSLFLLFVLLLALPARAESPGEKAMRLMDTVLTQAKDQHFVYEVITEEPGKEKRSMDMEVTIKGPTWRLVEFHAPGDVKGMKVLILSLSQMYVYLPAFKKIRRVAGHVRQQSFLGTALSQDDMSITSYGGTYAGKLLSEDKTHWRVRGTRRPGQDFPYAAIEFRIRKDNHYADELLYFNDKGQKVKSETRTDYICKGKVCNPKVMKMVDHSRGGLSTKLLMNKWEVNTGIADSAFTPRALQRAR